MAVSAARSIGPALAGLLLVAWGAGRMFSLNVLAFVGLTLVILAWRNKPPTHHGPSPSFGAAYRDGLRFATRNDSMRALLSKSVIVFLPISILLALLPLVVVENLGGSPGALGILLGVFGLGSVIASLLLQRLYRAFSRLEVINIAAILHALGVLLVANSANFAVSVAGMLLTGLAWTALMTSVNIIAQLLLPADMRGRGLSINNMTIMGVLAGGSAAWGQVAEWAGITETLVMASMLGLASPFLTRNLRPAERRLGE
jgi:predicted MFS family arabinose efflux permease